MLLAFLRLFQRDVRHGMKRAADHIPSATCSERGLSEWYAVLAHRSRPRVEDGHPFERFPSPARSLRDRSRPRVEDGHPFDRFPSPARRLRARGYQTRA